MTSDHACLFLTHLVYGLQACFGAGPDMPHSGSPPEQAASIVVPARGTKSHGETTRQLIELIPGCGIVTGHIKSHG